MEVTIWKLGRHWHILKVKEDGDLSIYTCLALYWQQGVSRIIFIRKPMETNTCTKIHGTWYFVGLD
jgi:hypothetical protein